MRFIKKWVLPLFPISRRNSIVVLDVGAGTGRMTRRLSKVASLCISIEPYPPFFKRLQASSNGPNVKFHQCTLQDYAKIADESFDLIFLSGVVDYHNDAEALQLLQLLHNLLKPNGFVLIEDWGVENERWGASPFESVMAQGKAEILRSPKGELKLVSQAGFRCLRWRRSYPVNIPEVLYSLWPNVATNLFFSICSLKVFFPLWGVLAALNLRHRSMQCFFTYLLQRDKTARFD